jgi:hypothetical protein
MQGGFFLDVVVGKGSSVFKLLSGEDESLLIGGNSFLGKVKLESIKKNVSKSRKYIIPCLGF